jgi:hypothetical protein
MRSPLVQPKLTVNQPGDKYEQEADTVASAVISPPAPLPQPDNNRASIQRINSEEGEPIQRLVTPESEPIQRAIAEEDKPIQRKGKETPHVSSSTAATIRSPGAGSSIPAGVRHQIEPHVGANLSGVRVHSGTDAHRAAASINALAFTYGNNIFLSRGESCSNVGLMAHEATHVVQQGSAPIIQRQPKCADCETEQPVQTQLLQRQPLAQQIETVQAKAVPGTTTPQPTASPAIASPTPGTPSASSAKSSAPPAIAPANKDPLPKTPEKQSTPSPNATPHTTNPPPAPPTAPPASAVGGAPGTGGDDLLMPEPPTSLSPSELNQLSGVQQNATAATKQQSALPDATETVTAAQKAVTEPDAETKARAGGNVVATLENKEPPSPEIDELCEKIRQAIREKRPPDEAKLVKSDPTKVSQQAGSQLNSSIQNNAQQAQGSYDSLQNAPQGSSQLQPQAIATPPTAIKPPSLEAQSAVPATVPAANVSLDADVAAGEKKMQDAGMNSEPAKLVTTGPIADAHAAQGELAETAAQDPAKVMAEQKAALDSAEADMVALQKTALNSLAASRVNTVTGVATKQKGAVTEEETSRKDFGTQAKSIFEKAQKSVEDLLKPLPQVGMKAWDTGVAIASEKFKTRLKKVEDWIKERHKGGWGAVVEFVDDHLTGLPSWVTDEYNAAEKEFGDDVCALIRKISSDVNLVIAACKGIIADARKEIDKLFAELPDDLKALATAEHEKFSQDLDNLQSKVTETRNNFNKDLVNRAATAVQEAREQIHALREKAKGLLGKLNDAFLAFLENPAKAILEGLLQLVGIPPAAFWALIAKIEKVIDDIANDPMTFANNLMAAIAEGFQRFFDNIKEHLLQGFLDWLLSGLGPLGVKVPKDTSLKSIITFFLELMGITWVRIRKLLVKHIGEKNVALLEKAFAIVSALIEMGPEGIFEFLKEKLDPHNMMKMVIDAAINFMITALIKKVAARIILLFNPAGAIAQAIEAIYRVLKWIFVNAAKIFSLVETIVNGIADIFAGNIGAMAKAVEKALGMLLVPVIDFLADYLGFGDLPMKIADVIREFQEEVEKVLDAAIGWLVEQGKKLLGIGDKEKKKDGKYDGQIGKEVKFTAAKENHRIWIVQQGNDAVVMMASEEKPLTEQLDDFTNIAQELQKQDDEDKKAKGDEVMGLIGEARSTLTELDSKTKELTSAVKNPDVKPEELPAKDDAVESGQDTIKAKMAPIIEKIRLKLGLKERFKAEFAKMDGLASEYSLQKLEEDKAIQKAESWQLVRTWLLTNGLIFTEPLTRTTKFAKQRTQEKAKFAAEDAIKAVNSDKEAEKLVEKNRSKVNAGEEPFSLAKDILQEYAFSEQISPYLTLKKAYVDKLNEIPPDVAAMVETLKSMQGVSGNESLIGYLESTKIFPHFRKGFEFQVERAIAYHQKGLLKAIEYKSGNQKGNISRFDLLIYDSSNKAIDDSDRVEVIVEVKHWIGFESRNPIEQANLLAKFISQLQKYQATGLLVQVDWKGKVPSSIAQAVQSLGIQLIAIP